MKNTNPVCPNPAKKAKLPQAVKSNRSVPELKVTTLRECLTDFDFVEEPKHIAKFWRENVETAPHFNPDVESLWIFLLNTRYRLIGFQQIGLGTKDTVIFEPGQVFRAAILKNADAIVMAHNHPSGDPSPSDADIKSTRDMLRAGRFFKIEVIDHIIFGDSKLEKPYASLRELDVLQDAPVVTSRDKKAAAKRAAGAVVPSNLVTSLFGPTGKQNPDGRRVQKTPAGWYRIYLGPRSKRILEMVARCNGDSLNGFARQLFHKQLRVFLENIGLTQWDQLMTMTDKELNEIEAKMKMLTQGVRDQETPEFN